VIGSIEVDHLKSERFGAVVVGVFECDKLGNLSKGADCLPKTTP
jgi:hypothetical protein